jgi:hypothetical protein
MNRNAKRKLIFWVLAMPASYILFFLSVTVAVSLFPSATDSSGSFAISIMVSWALNLSISLVLLKLLGHSDKSTILIFTVGITLLYLGIFCYVYHLLMAGGMIDLHIRW